VLIAWWRGGVCRHRHGDAFQIRVAQKYLLRAQRAQHSLRRTDVGSVVKRPSRVTTYRWIQCRLFPLTGRESVVTIGQD
ncbi:MAG: hypothetical protein ACN6PY_07240, partial [Paraburkholderia nemoris]